MQIEIKQVDVVSITKIWFIPYAILGLIILALFYGCIGAVGGLIFALFYNIVSKAVGGIRLVVSGDAVDPPQALIE